MSRVLDISVIARVGVTSEMYTMVVLLSGRKSSDV
jgi:hypothetical protein